MKTPISYYGGKQNLVPELLKLIPSHTQYGEPFCGGASLFWAKQPSKNEFINDADERVINFWRVLQSNFVELQTLIRATLHHELLHREAKEVLQAPITDPVKYAWAFWVQTQMSFSFRLFGGFAFGQDARSQQLTLAKRDGFTEKFYDRIKYAEIFHRNAIDLIQLKDDPDTFMYFDPPYPGSDCGHYEKGKNVYYDLLELLPSLKCKWLMSSYPSEQLTALRLKMGYNLKDIEQALSVSGKHNAGKTKTECLTWNYKQPQMTVDEWLQIN